MQPTSLPPAEDVKGIVLFIKKISEIAGEFFNRKTPTHDKFQSILQDLMIGRSSVIISEKIGGAIHQELSELQREMSASDYCDLCTNLCQSIILNFKPATYIWKGRVLYFENITEILVTCEPMLELVDNPKGTLDLLIRQIEFVDKVTYFLNNENYYYDLLKILQNRQVSPSLVEKVKYVKIDKPYGCPVVIYKSRKNQHTGLSGYSQPEVYKERDGTYNIRNPINNTWMQSINPIYINNHLHTLEQYNK